MAHAQFETSGQKAQPTAIETTIDPPIDAAALCSEITRGIVGFWYDEIRNHLAVSPRDLVPTFIKSTGITFKIFLDHQDFLDP